MPSLRTFYASDLAKQAMDIATGTTCSAHKRAWKATAACVSISFWPQGTAFVNVSVRCGEGCSRDVRVAP